MKKNFTIFWAIYGVFILGVLVLLLALKQNSLMDKINIIVTELLLVFIAVSITKILKIVIHKKRPPERIEFFAPVDRYAFPSGHATGLSAMTVFIFEKNVSLGVVSLLLGSVILVARVMSRVHDYIDIMGGIILGGVIAYCMSPIVESFVGAYISTHMFL